MKNRIIFIALIFILAACGGRKPQPDWTAREYYKYAQEIYDDESYLEAINELTVVTLRYPGSVVADSAQYLLAMCHYQLDEHLISAAEFKKLIDDMPQSAMVPDAQYMLAESYFQMSPIAELDQEYTIKALKEYQIFLEDFPTHAKRTEVEKKIVGLREKLALKQLKNANIYRKMSKYRASLIYYDIILQQYYDSEVADDALLGKALVFIEQENWQEAKSTLLEFKNRFEDSDLMQNVNKKLDEVLISEKKDLAENTD